MAGSLAPATPEKGKKIVNCRREQIHYCGDKSTEEHLIGPPVIEREDVKLKKTPRKHAYRPKVVRDIIVPSTPNATVNRVYLHKRKCTKSSETTYGSVEDCRPNEILKINKWTQKDREYQETPGSRFGIIYRRRNQHNIGLCNSIVGSSTQSASTSGRSQEFDRCLTLSSNARIPYGRGTKIVAHKDLVDTTKKSRTRVKVDLAHGTKGVRKIFVGKERTNGTSAVDMDEEKSLEEERQDFRGRVELFLDRVRYIQGDRRFSKWKGSVVDSVIGAFLTQNVSDRISSTAFMDLAAKFPVRSRGSETTSKSVSHGLSDITKQCMNKVQQEINIDLEKEHNQQEVNIMVTQLHNSREQMLCSNSCNSIEGLQSAKEAESNLKVDILSSKLPSKAEKNEFEAERLKYKTQKKNTFDWNNLRKEAFSNGVNFDRSNQPMDLVDWEAVRVADVTEISRAIQKRGMNNVLAGRIKSLLNLLVAEFGSVDLECLREIPEEKVKECLLSINGFGIKSVECVRLLTLHQPAFPVDTNVGRVCVRLGWVPLEPLPESLQLHLLELYPMVQTIQKYLWPRLCTLDQQTLYELHCQMITFGKVFCKKSKPNCNACPLRGECKHFLSASASAMPALPSPEEKCCSTSTNHRASENDNRNSSELMSELVGIQLSHDRGNNANCGPIIEEQNIPESESAECLQSEVNAAFYDDPNEFPVIDPTLEEITQNMTIDMEDMITQNMTIDMEDMGTTQDLVVVVEETMSNRMPKIKDSGRLRTKHQVYELHDSHPLLKEMDQREDDDPSPYLLAIWSPGETSQSDELRQSCCNFNSTGHCYKFENSGELCDTMACSTCSNLWKLGAGTIKGTFLIPCRTAVRGGFPLNGTYFQVNEVFVDHDSSLNPIAVPRKWIRNLRKRTVYFGTSLPTILDGLPTDDIRDLFRKGYICVRGFDRETRVPKPLPPRFHSKFAEEAGSHFQRRKRNAPNSKCKKDELK